MTRIAIVLLLLAAGCGQSGADGAAAAPASELSVTHIPSFYSAAEAYFSPDGNSLIFNGRRTEEESDYHVYTIRIGGQHRSQRFRPFDPRSDQDFIVGRVSGNVQPAAFLAGHNQLLLVDIGDDKRFFTGTKVLTDGRSHPSLAADNVVVFEPSD
ncbi:MAG: PD40 domain-containing protein [Bacteroidetes bacterium]|nr:PD40 domain-containing protein [Bacteroidota bacterium]